MLAFHIGIQLIQNSKR